MAIPANTDIESVSTELSTKAFSEFCMGMELMFDTNIQCSEQPASTNTIETVKDNFTGLVAAYAVEAKGSMSGKIFFLLDQRGMFTLPGIIVMHPPRRIEENCKRGSVDEIDPLLDAIKELGNLLVGAWDKISRQEFCDNTHLLHTATHAGTLTDISDDFFDISDDEEFTYMTYEITVESHSPFVCGAILPKSLFSEGSE